jgi:hypothetical protein
MHGRTNSEFKNRLLRNVLLCLSLKQCHRIIFSTLRVFHGLVQDANLHLFLLERGLHWAVLPMLFWFDPTQPSVAEKAADKASSVGANSSFANCSSSVFASAAAKSTSNPNPNAHAEDKNFIAVESLRLIQAMVSMQQQEKVSTKTNPVLGTFCSLLTEPGVRLLKMQASCLYILAAMNTNLETHVFVWSKDMRRELLEFIETQSTLHGDLFQESGQHHLEWVQNHQFTSLCQELCVGNVYLRHFVDDQRTVLPQQARVVGDGHSSLAEAGEAFAQPPSSTGLITDDKLKAELDQFMPTVEPFCLDLLAKLRVVARVVCEDDQSVILPNTAKLSVLSLCRLLRDHDLNPHATSKASACGVLALLENARAEEPPRHIDAVLAFLSDTYDSDIQDAVLVLCNLLGSLIEEDLMTHDAGSIISASDVSFYFLWSRVWLLPAKRPQLLTLVSGIMENRDSRVSSLLEQFGGLLDCLQLAVGMDLQVSPPSPPITLLFLFPS